MRDGENDATEEEKTEDGGQKRKGGSGWLEVKYRS